MSIENYKNTVTIGDSYEVIKNLPDNSIDSCVTDPPYGLSKEPNIVEVLTRWMNDEEYIHPNRGFMGKEWDSFVPSPLLWKEVYRVLKPGAHILCFAGTRTQDLMTISLRLAGFEIRDVIEWLYISGFPKSMDVSKQFDKLAGVEREVIGASNVGDIRGGNYASGLNKGIKPRYEQAVTIATSDLAKRWDGWGTALKPAHEPIILARKPLERTVCDTVKIYDTGAINIGECRIELTNKEEELRRNARGGENGLCGTSTFKIRERNVEDKPKPQGRFPANCITLESDQWYSNYFNITPAEISKKASQKDRNSDWQGNVIELPKNNFHPTVKPTELMSWLIRLVTPKGGIVLDIFGGSGSTAVAAKREVFDFIIIEREPEYAEIAQKRVC